MTKDGWSTELIYTNDGGAGDRGYTVMSHGSDSADGPAPQTAGIVKLFTEDIKWSNGRFIQRPEGSQKSGQ